MENKTETNNTNQPAEVVVTGKLTLNFERPHRSQSDGKQRFIYGVTGDQSALDQYIKDKIASGFDPKRKDGTISFFCDKLVPSGTELVRQKKGYWYPESKRLEILAAATKEFGSYEMAKDVMSKDIEK